MLCGYGCVHVVLLRMVCCGFGIQLENRWVRSRIGFGLGFREVGRDVQINMRYAVCGMRYGCRRRIKLSA